MSKIETREFCKRAASFLAVWFVVLFMANTASAQGLDLSFMDKIMQAAESVADHPLWGVALALMAFGCLVMYGVTSRKEFLFALIIPVLMAGAVINWRSLMQSFIAGLRLS